MCAYLVRKRRNEPKLRWELSPPPGDVEGAVLVTHGYAEHSERYEHVVRAWNLRGLLVATYDLRGHGRSGGPRGHVESFDDYVKDVLELLDELDGDPRWADAGPPVLFGHSLGGLISAHVALRSQEQFRGLAVTSPFFGLGVRVPRVQLAAGRFMSRIAPWFPQRSKLGGKDMTHDAAIAARYDADPLGFKHVTVRWFTETMKAQERLLESAPRLSLPLFCLAAGTDRVVSVEATRRVVERASSAEKELVVVEDRYHELLNETDRSEHIERLAERMLSWVS